MKRIILAVLLLISYPVAVYAEAEMRFSGTLVEEPCSLAPADSAIEIDFGSVINKLLYSHQRTLGKPLTLHLLECDLSLGETVSVTFLGTEDIQQPGLIALDAESTASGVAVGFETVDNILVLVNQPSQRHTLKMGSNELNFLVYISAASDAVRDKAITPGSLKTSAIFSFNYE